MKYLAFLVLFLLGQNISYAHKNQTVTQDFGNIKVIYTSGFLYEELNKTLIIGQYAEDLSKKMDFSHQITLLFQHQPNLREDEIYYSFKNNGLKNKIPEEIFLEMKDSQFAIPEVLKLIEYSIVHQKNLSIGSVNKEPEKTRESRSETLKNVLANKVYRPAIVGQLDTGIKAISYFYQKDGFHVFRIENGVEKILFKYKNIYQIAALDENSLLLFDTKKSFHYISSNRLEKASKKIKINRTKEQILPYKVHLLSNHLLSITFSELRNNKPERVMLYDYKKEKTLQNLYEYLKW